VGIIYFFHEFINVIILFSVADKYSVAGGCLWQFLAVVRFVPAAGHVKIINEAP
jgi:hypothetical protein